MPHSDKIPIIKLPMKLKFNKEPKRKFLTEKEAIKVTLINTPSKNYKEICCQMIMSTWRDKSYKKYSKKEINEVFLDMLHGKTLPNSMEMLSFTFQIEGLTHIEISHMLRHRSFSAVHALCSGDRDLRYDNIMIPQSIKNSKFRKEYKDLSIKAKELYVKMVDDKKISLMDARYILSRNHLYYYFFTMNLKDAINFIKQRMCTQVQPQSDNIIAHKIRDHLIKFCPELESIIPEKCDKRCHYVRTANTGKATNLYLPDKTHDIFYWNENNFLYKKRRSEMNGR